MAIYYLPITHTSVSLRGNSLFLHVSKARREKGYAYHFPKDQKLSLYAALLARYCISQIFQIPAHQLVFSSKHSHKPFCDTIPTCDFSISHTDGMILIGVSDKGSIGVDVECNKDAPYAIMPSVFHNEEISYIKDSMENQSSRFFQIWTQKEAYTKALGTGLCTDVTNINTLSLSDHIHSWQDESYVYSVYYEYYVPEKPIHVSEKELLTFYQNCPFTSS